MNDLVKYDLESLRSKLSGKTGSAFWRSLDELAQTDEFLRFAESEFPAGIETLSSGVGRRDFLKIMGASMALMGLTGCRSQPREEVVPYVESPPEITPGVPLQYATTLGQDPCGVLVESHMGRPTGISGNPEHPASLGGCDAITQAEILSLYDPDRTQTVTRAGSVETWDSFIQSLEGALRIQEETEGAGVRILTQSVTSPFLAHQLDEVKSRFPKAQWHHFEAITRDNQWEGSRIAFGEVVATRYRIDRAAVILSIDADFLCSGPGHLVSARAFARGRRVSTDHREMNRLYQVESTPTSTGTMADHRLALGPSDILRFMRALAAKLGIGIGPAIHQDEWLARMAEDLIANRGRCLLIVGDHLPAEIHALAHVINEQLDSVGTTVEYTAPSFPRTDSQMQSIAGLVKDMDRGAVEVLLILGGNPVYDAPVDLNFATALEKVPLRIHSSLLLNETSDLCHWNVPRAHPLEAWGDQRSFEGTLSLVQPLILPLYGGLSDVEVASKFTKKSITNVRAALREFLQNVIPSLDEGGFRKILHDGFAIGTRFEHQQFAVQEGWEARLAGDTVEDSPAGAKDSLELLYRADPTIGDGRHANNGWLQELPKPLTRLTWDNAALVSPRTAQDRSLSNGDIVIWNLGDRSLEAPVWITPGQAAGCVTMHLGYGRWRAGRVGSGTGFNAYALRTSRAPWSAGDLQIARNTRRKYRLATTQNHHSMEGRDLVRVNGFADILEGLRVERDDQELRGQVAGEKHGEKHGEEHGEEHDSQSLASFYPPWDYDGNKWGMVINLNGCTGCNACLIACQSENNISVVGKVQVELGRELHWIRIDRYFEGDLDQPRTYNQPVPCMHCENAPCEVVCPVGATVHSSEGLNQMVYNRCVGTRYCSNNCPYKVRRFNFLQYADTDTESLMLGRNPDVTVRNRGVMEKCTYCVQRINLARIDAKKEDREIRDGEVVTACQSACPSEAIVFGNLNDPSSQVSRLTRKPENYSLLEEVGTRPRTTYLPRISNPNPRMPDVV